MLRFCTKATTSGERISCPPCHDSVPSKLPPRRPQGRLVAARRPGARTAQPWLARLPRRGHRRAARPRRRRARRLLRRYLNARATTVKLLKMRAVPVINENDTVATSEIRYGDNDRLAARVATMIGADLLVLFSDVDGLYTAPPAGDPTARHIAAVERITPAIEAMAGGAGSDLSRGGMRTKIEAGKIATVSGIHMVIADGRRERPLKAIADGARCTWFLTPSNPVTARKGWIAGALEPRGTLVVDAGAARALAGGASLLPVGVRRIEGAFARGDAVVVSDGARELGRGLVAYDADEAERIIGRASREIEDILGYPGRTEMIHRDDLALTQPLAAKVG